MNSIIDAFVIFALVRVSGFTAGNPLRTENVSALVAVVVFIRSRRIISGAVAVVIGTGVPICIVFTAVRGGRSFVSGVGDLLGIVMSCRFNNHTSGIGDLLSGGKVPEELAAAGIAALIVFLVAGVGAGGRLCFLLPGLVQVAGFASTLVRWSAQTWPVAGAIT